MLDFRFSTNDAQAHTLVRGYMQRCDFRPYLCAGFCKQRSKIYNLKFEIY